MKPVAVGHLAANVRTLRHDAGFTQERLAELAAIEPRYVQRIEAATANPTVGCLASLATALQVDITRLFRATATLDARPPGRPTRTTTSPTTHTC